MVLLRTGVSSSSSLVSQMSVPESFCRLDQDQLLGLTTALETSMGHVLHMAYELDQMLQAAHGVGLRHHM